MKIIETVKEMQTAAEGLRLSGKKIGLVPTMGYLHEGHLSLVDEVKKRSDVVVMSVYVNPTQFAQGEDLDKYPRDLSRDEKNAAERGVNYLFVPSDREMYPEEHLSFIELNKVSHILEGEFRPTHFKGVATVVAKLLNIVKPAVALFGQKDAQQAFIIRKMVRDLNFDVEIVVAPIVREEDGLALSSRNVYLSQYQRKQANVLYRSLKLAESNLSKGETSLEKVRSAMVRLISSESEGKIDYVSFVEPATFCKIEEAGSLAEILALLAVRFGQTRLIDNMLLKVRQRTQ
ncbi:MAG: pantoate--beta-alanine ligase [Bacteroidetes bacterium]|nr:pantoate--beta-alanine ligase [Bacteroidota bacterium]MCL5034148.1 pantoate--beta-alanine ligase [Bacteroidota bacterium]